MQRAMMRILNFYRITGLSGFFCSFPASSEDVRLPFILPECLNRGSYYGTYLNFIVHFLLDSFGFLCSCVSLPVGFYPWQTSSEGFLFSFLFFNMNGHCFFLCAWEKDEEVDITRSFLSDLIWAWPAILIGHKRPRSCVCLYLDFQIFY